MPFCAPFRILQPLHQTRLFVFGAVLYLGLLSVAQAQVKLDVPYVPTPYDTVHRMLELADVQPDDKLIDLGSGDGRIVVQAARDWGVSGALGVDIDPERIEEARQNARATGVDDRVEFIRGDLFEMDFSEATVLTMYLLESINQHLRPIILEQLRPGTRVVSHVFGMGNWKPDTTIQARGLQAFLWIVPARVGGNWRLEAGDGSTHVLSFSQEFQQVDGMYQVEDTTQGMTFCALRGDEIRFTVAGKHYIGRVEGDSIIGVPGPGAVSQWQAKRI